MLLRMAASFRFSYQLVVAARSERVYLWQRSSVPGLLGSRIGSFRHALVSPDVHSCP